MKIILLTLILKIIRVFFTDVDIKNYQSILAHEIRTINFSLVKNIYMPPSNLNYKIEKNFRIQQQKLQKQHIQEK